MPYSSNDDLPDAVRNALPAAAQTRFREVVNSALDRKLSEEKAFASAWSVVRNGWKKGDDGKWIRKSDPRTLYICRKVLNADKIIAWAKAQGFGTTLPADDMHVTVCYSRTAIDWMKIPEEYPANEDDDGKLTVRSSPVRVVQKLGPKGAVVLMFNHYMLSIRHETLKQLGATWDHPEYQPHITISYEPGDVDVEKVEPYRGEIILGPEIFETIDEDWSAGVSEKFEIFTKVENVDESLGLVFGWAIVCKHDGKEYYDLQDDYVPEEAMLKAATDFMQHSRIAGRMHEKVGEEGDEPVNIGSILFAWPMTEDIAKAMGIETKNTGLMIAMKPDSAEELAKFVSGEYTGFSIGGLRLIDEEEEYDEAA